MSKLWGGHDGSGHKVSVIATIRAKRGKQDELRDALAALVEPSVAETGCVRYYVLEDKYVEGSFFTYEEWESEAALKKHLEVNKAALDRAKNELADVMDIKVLTMVHGMDRETIVV
jgi:quinol monooxygenase YgiN